MIRQKNLAMHSTHIIDQALEALSADLGEELVDEIRPILHANLREGRVTSYLDSRQGDLLQYVRRVARTYLQENSRLVALQVQRDTDAWSQLGARLQGWAVAYLQQTAPSRQPRPELAAAACNRCAQRILRERFPFDLAFHVWAMFLVHQACHDIIDQR